MTAPCMVTGALKDEHRAFRRMLDELEGALDPIVPARVGALLAELEGQLVRHRRKEEGVLLPALARFGGVEAEALHAVQQDHGLEEGLIEEAKSFLGHLPTDGMFLTPLVNACRAVIHFYREHLAREERDLFPAAEAAIPDDIKWELLDRMAKFVDEERTRDTGITRSTEAS